MQNLYVYEYQDQRYRKAYDHLNSRRFLFTVRATPPVCVREPEDYDDGGVYVQYARVRPGVDRARLARAMSATLSGSACSHEYDCCGCASYYVRVTPYGRRGIKIRTSVTYNY